MSEDRKFLSKIKLTGAAGVDHPAHEHSGWLVMKSAGDPVADAIRDALRSTYERASEERRNLDEIRQLIADNQRMLNDLDALLNGRSEKAHDDLRPEAASLADKVQQIRSWTGTDVRQSIQKAERLTASEASRLFWGLDA